MESQATHQETTGAILHGVLSDVRTLIRDEFAIARVELSARASRLKGAAISFGIAAVALAFGATFLLIALATGIADVLNWPVWAGFVIVAMLLSLVGLVTLASGRRQLQQVQNVPHETVSTLKENSEWIAKRLSSALK